jgi:glycosyltransferase involved in cell wall biosynthesis
MSTSSRETQASRSGDPIVSVIIPTYNRAHVLARAIQSVLDQTYQDFEMIVVDDGSNDNTEEVVKSFNDPRIRYIRHEGNRGAAAARNTGIKAAKGKFIAFQDSDDEWLPEKLQKQMKVFENAPARVGVVYTGFWSIEGNVKQYGPNREILYKEGDIHSQILQGNFIGTPAAVVKKACFEKAGMFDERLPRLIDWELWIRVSKYFDFKFIDEPLGVAYFVGGGIRTNEEALITAQELILETHYGEFERAGKKILAKQLFRAGNLLCLYGKTSQGREYVLRARKLFPALKYFVATYVSLLGPEAYKLTAKLSRGCVKWLEKML